ncbi:MAG TPA: protein-disulfide reductase DsbD domain-containing protein [Pyrinomonadaceae bacterium]|jgi:hypothetical protein
MRRNIIALLACSIIVSFSAACSATDERTANQTVAPASSPATATASTNNAAPSTEVAGATAQAPPSQVVNVNPSEVKVRAGGSADAEVRLEIAQGYHINANPPTHKYLIPTQIEATVAEGIDVGKPVYPKALTKKFNFDQTPLAVYESEATIKLPLRIASNTPAGERTLPVKIRVQPCDNQACYPPRTIATSIRVLIQ